MEFINGFFSGVGIITVGVLVAVLIFFLLVFILKKINFIFDLVGSSKFFMSNHGGMARYRIRKMRGVLRKARGEERITKAQYNRLDKELYDMERGLIIVYGNFIDNINGVDNE